MIECCKCGKKVEIKKAKKGYGDYFCGKRCYGAFKKQAEEELDKGLKEIGL